MIRRSTLVILVIFAGLVALAIFLQRSNAQKEALITPTEGSQSLFNFDSQISGLRLEHVGNAIVEIERDENGIWKLTNPPAEATDIGAVEGAVSQLLSIPIVSTLDQGPSLEAAGLTAPNYRVLILLENGAQQLMSVGKETPTGSGYYVLVSNRGMYIVNKYSLDPFLKLVDNPPIATVETPLENEYPYPESQLDLQVTAPAP